MSSISDLMEQVRGFRDARDWKQFHTSKDMLLSLYLEVAELGEYLQWKTEEEFVAWLEKNRASFAEELADVLYWILLIAHDSGVDLEQAFQGKMEQNALKYPVEKAKGSKEKYTDL